MRVKGFPSLSILCLLCLPVLPSGLPAGEPQIIAIRPIQFEYPEFTQRTGGLTRVWWDATQGAFSEFQVLVDGNLEATVPGGELSADLGELPLGAHQVKVAGLVNSVEAASLETSFSILQSPPVQGVEALPCLFHSYQAATGGFLEILWNNRDTAETPYVDFDIIVNDVFQGVLEAPSRGLRFGRVFLGMYRVEVQAYTWNHICLPAEFVCQAEDVAGPLNAACRPLRCVEDRTVFQITYDVPPGPTPEAVALFDLAGGPPGDLVGIFAVGAELTTNEVPPGVAFSVELALIRGDSVSALPGYGTEHAVTTCAAPAVGCVPPFLRGDSTGDGSVDLSDAVHMIFILFGGEEARCLESSNANGDAAFGIADVTFTLGYLFRQGAAPPPPGPGACAFEPAPKLGCEEYTCAG